MLVRLLQLVLLSPDGAEHNTDGLLGSTPSAVKTKARRNTILVVVKIRNLSDRVFPVDSKYPLALDVVKFCLKRPLGNTATPTSHELRFGRVDVLRLSRTIRASRRHLVQTTDAPFE